ncbi:hypothetical protein Aperf_G00000129680 [Anoplocephala perfoliata]
MENRRICGRILVIAILAAERAELLSQQHGGGWVADYAIEPVGSVGLIYHRPTKIICMWTLSVEASPIPIDEPALVEEALIIITPRNANPQSESIVSSSGSPVGSSPDVGAGGGGGNGDISGPGGVGNVVFPGGGLIGVDPGPFGVLSGPAPYSGQYSLTPTLFWFTIRGENRIHFAF